MLIGTVRDCAQLKNKLTFLQFHRVVFLTSRRKINNKKLQLNIYSTLWVKCNVSLLCCSRACSETMQTGESRFHLSTPKEIWTRVPYDGKQMGSQLDQWDRVRMKWDCRLSTGLPPPAADPVGCEARRRTCSECETGTEKLCEIKWDYHIVGSRAQWWFGTERASDKATEMINHIYCIIYMLKIE